MYSYLLTLFNHLLTAIFLVQPRLTAKAPPTLSVKFLTMATSEERYITDPAQLEDPDLAVKLSDLDLAGNPQYSGESTQYGAQRLRLALLQPLVNPAMFAACRVPEPKTVRIPNHSINDAASHEYLDISALDKAWRKALVKLPPASHVTFDLSLPKPVDDSDPPRKIFWETAMPRTGNYAAISARTVMRLVASIATVTRMRAQGDVHFELIYNETEGVSPAGMGMLAEQLRLLAKAKGTAQTGTVKVARTDADPGSADAAGDEEDPGPEGPQTAPKTQQIDETA